MMQRIFIPLDEEQSLAALLFSPASAARAVLIVCHGFRGGKENGGQIIPFAQALTDRGLLVVAFDFSGCGESSGEFSPITLSRQVRDLEQVCAYVQSNYNLPQMVLGRSFGGSTAIAAASCLPGVSAYILWSAPFDLNATFALILDQDYERLAAGDSVIMADEAGSFKLEPDLLADMQNHNMSQGLQAMLGKPVLLVHGEDDEVVPVENVRQIAAHLPDAALYIIPGADHRFSEHIQQRQAITLGWIDTCFPANGI